MELVGAKLAEISAKPRRTGADNDGYAPYWGYRGPRLSDLTGERPVDADMLVESLRRVKSATEIACIQLSCDWAGRAHRRMQKAITTGKTEMECYAPAATETLFEMVAEMPGWRPRGFSTTGLEAMFEPGMVFTAEPGVYLKELGGFRHSDTVVITDDGCRLMTDYPRELKDLIIP